MRPIEAIVLGVVQGISEFLPISSSAHLILTSRFLGWADQGLSFDMAANSGSLLAVVLFLRRELVEISVSAVHGIRRLVAGSRYGLAEARPAFVLVIATLPVAIAGWLGRDLVAGWARDPLVIAATSILFALLLLWADRRPEGELFLSDISLRTALLVGLAQALALIPGTSRAGVTLTAALLLGLSRQAAVRLSFLLAVPVGTLVALKQLLESAETEMGAIGIASSTLGFLAAGVSAYAAVAWLLRWVRRQDLLLFVIYRLALGALILAALVR